MLNLIAFVICTLATIAQWSKDWVMVAITSGFALINLIFGIVWLKNKIRNRKWVNTKS